MAFFEKNGTCLLFTELIGTVLKKRMRECLMPETTSTERSKECRVLEAATRVFLTHGFSAATTDMIQREAHVSKATVYACYPNKEAMFAAVIENECTAMTASIKAIDTSPGNIAKTLTHIGLSYLQIVLSPAGLRLYRVAIAEAPRFPALGRQFYLSGPKTVITMVVEILKNAQEAKEIDIRTIGVEAAATLFISMIRGEGQMEVLTHPHSLPSVIQMEQWVERAVTTFIAAYKK
jgi:AcrR family transcriptional regulator